MCSESGNIIVGISDSAPTLILAAAAPDATHSLTSRHRVERADPVRVFEEFATLDLLSQGRANVVGRGSFTEAFPLFGLNLKDYIRYLRRNGFASEAARKRIRSLSGKHVRRSPARASITSLQIRSDLAGWADTGIVRPAGTLDCRSWLPSLAADTRSVLSLTSIGNMAARRHSPTSSKSRSCLVTSPKRRTGMKILSRFATTSRIGTALDYAR